MSLQLYKQQSTQLALANASRGVTHTTLIVVTYIYAGAAYSIIKLENTIAPGQQHTTAVTSNHKQFLASKYK